MYSQTVAQESPRHHGESAEDLMRSQLEPLLRFVGFFTEDESDSIAVVQEALRDAISAGAVHTHGLYRAACSLLRTHPAAERAMGTLAHTGGLCLLLKDLAGLRYADIADVLGLDSAQVRTHIASARTALLPAV